MKTIEELFNEIIASDELKKEFAEAGQTKEGAEAFLKKYECSATLEEAAAFLKEQEQKAQELSNESLENVSGGNDVAKTFWGIVTVAVLGLCIPFAGAVAAASAAVESAGKCYDVLLGDD